MFHMSDTAFLNHFYVISKGGLRIHFQKNEVLLHSLNCEGPWMPPFHVTWTETGNSKFKEL